jgi:hypothetical protein
MTFTDLEFMVRRVIGQSIQIDVIALLREAENDFIESTHCYETIDSVDTDTLGNPVGTLSATYDLPAGFVEELRFEWDGRLLAKAHRKSPIWLMDTSGAEFTGRPMSYWVENGKIRFLPKPSSHGQWGRWYISRNMVTNGTSPVIPTLEHKVLANYAIKIFFEIRGEFEKAEYYENKYLVDCSNAYERYKRQRGDQKRLIDVVGGMGGAAVNFYPFPVVAEP